MKLDKDFYTRKDIADLFDRSEQTIYKWEKSGKFPRSGAHGLWSRSVIEIFFNASQCSKAELKVLLEALR